jgi:Flp pilus assembly CpaE family ATPase
MRDKTQLGDAATASNQNIPLQASVPDTLRASVKSIVVIGPDEELRQRIAANLALCHDGEILQFSSYPAGLDDVPQLLQRHDVIMIELDSNPEYALDLVESICMKRTSTVMVYSRYPDPDPSDPDLLVRCMRAGARELLSEPFDQTNVAEALVRAAARRAVAATEKKTGGRVLVFCGAKGGVGVTSIACAFARALTDTSSERTLLIDLNLPLGDAGLILGITPKHSTIDALQDPSRLDPSLLSKLITQHSSGLYVLAAPGRITPVEVSNAAIDKLITVARQAFDNVVIDAGSGLDLKATNLAEQASNVYLVTQPVVSDLRNSNRLISELFMTDKSPLQIILNRSERRGAGITEDNIRTALTQPAHWKVPDDSSAIERLQKSPAWLTGDSALATVVETIARSLYGLPEVTQKRKKFSFKESFGRLRISGNDDPSPAPVSLGLTSALSTLTSKEPAKAPPQVSAHHSDLAHGIPEHSASGASTPPRTPQEEVRIYKGKKYVRGNDNQWHLEESASADAHNPQAVAPRPAREPLKVTWPTPEPITYGTALGSAQYNPTASVAGKFAFTPAFGYVLPAGTHSLWCTFTPDDAAEQAPVQLTVSIVVRKAAPAIRWDSPIPIQRGTKLGSAQLSATASIPGTFTYSPSEGEELAEGLHSIRATFTPQDLANYIQETSEVSLRVLKPSPAIVWNNPDTISYGSPLSVRELNATSEIAGTFTYSPDLGQVLNAGHHALTATFTPADTEHYAVAEISAHITVLRATPIVNWLDPQPISYGTPLDSKQLCAHSQVPGTFSYSPNDGTVLPADSHELATVFTPDDAINYNVVEATTHITILKAKPAIVWSPLSGITYGTALDEKQLNATSSVPGTFTYLPGKGAVLSAGDHRPSLLFTPTDQGNYVSVRASVSIRVAQATPELKWENPKPIAYGTPLGTTQLSAVPSVPGTLEYSPACGETLDTGEHILSVCFLPSDNINYSSVQTTVPLQVKEAAAPTIDWPAPEPITFGTKLSSLQLNAKAPIPGSFTYSSGEGELLPAGRHVLTLRFTPENKNLPSVECKSMLTVAKASPVISWQAPAPIVFGTPLGDLQLHAEAQVSGRFVFTPAVGEILPAGKRMLSVAFTPSDADNYLDCTHTVSIEVRKSVPSISWNSPSLICYGTPLSILQLNAKASVPGKFTYVPSQGTVLTPGTHTLTAHFAPDDGNNYSANTASISLQVSSLEEFTPDASDHPVRPPATAGLPEPSHDLPAPARPMPIVEDRDIHIGQAGSTQTNPAAASSQVGHRSTQAAIVQFPRPSTQPETRIYKGATYVKGDDGKWYLQS